MRAWNSQSPISDSSTCHGLTSRSPSSQRFRIGAPDQAELEAWLVMLRAPGLGGVGQRKLIAHFGSARAVIEAGRGAWLSAGLAGDAVQALERPDRSLLETDVAWLQRPNHRLIVFCEVDFPPLLGEIAAAPAALFVVGRSELLPSAQIAVVGSRNPTSGGRDNARSFARALAATGLTITSGLAAGIDAVAHEAALDLAANTIAVMGTGPDILYPRANGSLGRRIADQGCLITEFPPGTPARREHFPRRNRTIAGLTLGTLVVEAAVRSGALITARLANEAGREVFALPGSIHNPLARGCHQLIRDGAHLVETASEIGQAIAPAAQRLGAELRQRLGADESAPSQAEVTAVERQILQALGHDPVGLDQLAERTGLTVSYLSPILLALELGGQVVTLNGRYARHFGRNRT